MRILGIDPGIGRLGWGIVEKTGKQQVHVVRYGCIETFGEQSLSERLVIVYEKLQELLEEYKPEAVGIEDLFFNKNVKTAFAVGQARGVVLLALEQKGIPITVYTPSVIKSTVAGYGKADKKQVGQMVKLTLKLDKVPTPDDTADALAIALTHAFTHKYA